MLCFLRNSFTSLTEELPNIFSFFICAPLPPPARKRYSIIMPHAIPLPVVSNGNAVGAADASPVLAIAAAQGSRADVAGRTERCPACSCGAEASDAATDTPPVRFGLGEREASGSIAGGVQGQSGHGRDYEKYFFELEARMARQDKELEAVRAQHANDSREIHVLRQRVLRLEEERSEFEPNVYPGMFELLRLSLARAPVVVRLPRGA